jgi:periplasmic copper chaperone A
MHWIATGLAAVAIVMLTTAADTPSNAIVISDAWIPATNEAPVDTPLYMTITNNTDRSDSLVRARCPTELADFTEKHATDRGEGGTTMRVVKNFTIPSQGSVKLQPGGDHLMLHIRAPLQPGQTFSCAMSFQAAGTVNAQVTVTTGASGAATGRPD